MIQSNNGVRTDVHKSLKDMLNNKYTLRTEHAANIHTHCHLEKVKIFFKKTRKKYTKMFNDRLIWGGRIVVDFFAVLILLSLMSAWEMDLEYTCQNVERFCPS